MLAPLSWLKEYVEIDVTPQELQEKLFSCGFEVEELHQAGEDISGVVVGLVETCEPVPDTHLHVTTVNAGEHGIFQVCCGADNVAAGKKFPLALVGATVYQTAKDHVTVEGVMKIRKGKLRGYDSYGMLCSGTELGLNEDLYPGAGYNGLLELPDDASVGADIKPIVGLDDWLFDIAVTANRPDCQSIFGIAREVAAVLGKKLKEPSLEYHPTEVEKEGFSVTVEDADLCPRYIGHYVYDVRIAPSPAWMRRRLALAGMNSISNIVDITNYVLLELGQPMHAFDEDFIRGGRIVVRRAKKGEVITTLDEQEYVCGENTLCICDAEGPVALAGVMGGLNSEIRDTTGAVLYESAKFMRDNIRHTSRALGKRTDASARFEKGVDEYTTVMAMKRALHLTEELGCGKVARTHCDTNTGNSVEPSPLTVSIRKVNAVLGIQVPTGEILRILSNLGFAPEADGDALHLMVPAFRTDIENDPDISEEVIRMYGYDHIRPTMLATAAVTAGGLTLKQKTVKALKERLCAEGLYEAMHYSFYSPADLDLMLYDEDAPEREAIRILNPINEDLSILRTTLSPSMMRAIERNEKAGIIEGRLFEIASRFEARSLPLSDYPEEKETLCAGIWGPNESFFTLKGIADTVARFLRVHFTYQALTKPFLHPYQCAEIVLEGERVGYLGTVRYEVMKTFNLRTKAYLLEIDLSLLEKYYDSHVRFTPIPKFPVEKRDLALVMSKSITCAQVEEAIRSASKYVSDVSLFDIYEGIPIPKDRRSMAFTVTFTPQEEELTPDIIDSAVSKILKVLHKTLDIDLRE